MKKKIISPCISICKTDPVTGYCYGCARTDDEKKQWKSESTTEEWKLENLRKIKSRMQGWQLNTFEESYKYKINQGISLFKKKTFRELIYKSFFIESISLRWYFNASLDILTSCRNKKIEIIIHTQQNAKLSLA